jgi:hypothetical protein
LDVQDVREGNPLLADSVTRFRDAVTAYWNPDTEGFNKYNSARVDDFYRALDGVGILQALTQLEAEQRIDAAPVLAPQLDENDGQVQALLVTVAALTHDDAQYILNESPSMIAKINRHLGGQARTDVRQRLHQR